MKNTQTIPTHALVELQKFFSDI